VRSRHKPKPPQLACIREGYGPLYIEEDYRILGVREGWLVWDGFFLNGHGQLVNVYRLRSPPK